MRYAFAVLNAAIAAGCCGLTLEWVNSAARRPLPSPTQGAIIATVGTFLSLLVIQIRSMWRMDYIRRLQNVIVIQVHEDQQQAENP